MEGFAFEIISHIIHCVVGAQAEHRKRPVHGRFILQVKHFLPAFEHLEGKLAAHIEGSQGVCQNFLFHIFDVYGWQFYLFIHRKAHLEFEQILLDVDGLNHGEFFGF